MKLHLSLHIHLHVYGGLHLCVYLHVCLCSSLHLYVWLHGSHSSHLEGALRVLNDRGKGLDWKVQIDPEGTLLLALVSPEQNIFLT